LTIKGYIAIGTAAFGLIAAGLLVAERYYNVVRAKREADKAETDKGKDNNTVPTTPTQNSSPVLDLPPESKVRESIKGRWASQLNASNEYFVFSFGDSEFRACLCVSANGKGRVVACAYGLYGLTRGRVRHTITPDVWYWSDKTFNSDRAPTHSCEIIKIQGKQLHLRTTDGFVDYHLFKDD
jgi:hypothetical protein